MPKLSHADLVREVAERLRSSPKSLSDHAYEKEDVPADATFPYYVVGKGRARGGQADVWVESRVAAGEDPGPAAAAAMAALTGFRTRGVEFCVLTDTGTPGESPDGYAARRDLFAFTRPVEFGG